MFINENQWVCYDVECWNSVSLLIENKNASVNYNIYKMWIFDCLPKRTTKKLKCLNSPSIENEMKEYSAETSGSNQISNVPL